MSEQTPPRLYTAEEWAAMSEHDRAVVREDRRRAVERAREDHEARQNLLDSLTVERFTHDQGGDRDRC